MTRGQRSEAIETQPLPLQISKHLHIVSMLAMDHAALRPATRSRCTSCWLRTFQYRVTHGTWESREISLVALSGASWTRYAVTRRPDASTTTSRDTGIREPPDAYYLTRIQALISDLLSEGCDIDLAARQGTLGLTLALRSARRSSSYLT